VIGHLLAYLFDVAFWFFVISVFVLPVVMSYWRAREKRDAERTAQILDSLLHDTTHQYEQDAL